MQDTYYNSSFQKYPFVDPLQSKNADLSLIALLSNYIQHVAKKEREYFSRYVPILQSTGYGKSRLVFELAKSTEPVVVVPICLRPYDATGEPLRTEHIANMIEYTRMTELQWATFFAALVEEVATRVKEQPALKTDVSLRQSWYNALSGAAPEAASFSSSSSSSAAASSSISSISGLEVGYGTVFWNAVWNRWNEKRTTAAETFGASSGSWSDCLSADFSVSTTEEPSTKQAYPNQMLPGDYTIVLALDECASTLMKTFYEADGTQVTYIIAMARTLSCLNKVDCTLVCLLLDTSSKIVNLSPEYRLVPSRRVASTGTELYAPFYAFPHRLFKDEEYLAHEAIRTYRTRRHLTAAMISDVEAVNLVIKRNPLEDYLRSRPLFASRVINEARAGVSGDKIWSILFSMVYYKLRDSERLSKMHGTDLYHFSLAAIRWQIMTISQADQADLLHLHLAVLYGVASRNVRIYCGYPLEPALVRCAATIMAQDLTTMQLSVLKAVQKRQMESMLVTNDGTRVVDEMVALMLLCFAHDRALQDASQGMSNWYDYGPITFMRLIEQLYPSENFTSMLDELVALHSPEALQQLQTALVYFTGGRKLEVEASVEHLRAALKEGMVLMVKHCQEGMDAIIPLVLPKYSAGTERTIVDLEDPTTYDLSCVCVQITNTKMAESAALLVRNMMQTEFARQRYDEHPPLVLFLVMQLGDLDETEQMKKGGLIQSEDSPSATFTLTSSSSAASTTSTISMEMRLSEGPPCIGGRTSKMCRLLRDIVYFSDKDFLLNEGMMSTKVKDAQSAVKSYRDLWFYERSFGVNETAPSKDNQGKAGAEEEEGMEEVESEEEPYDAGQAKLRTSRALRSYHRGEKNASKRGARQKSPPARGGPKRQRK